MKAKPVSNHSRRKSNVFGDASKGVDRKFSRGRGKKKKNKTEK